MLAVASQWIHLVTITAMVFLLSVGQAVIRAAYSVLPLSTLLDALSRRSARIRSMIRSRLGRDDAGGDRPANAEQMIRRAGFAVEEHAVTTRDGFVLGPRPAVLLMHGLLQNSESFLVDGGTGVLPFALANAGFDVWLGNTRGNRYSAKHTRLSPESEAYWDFCIDDFARFDVPAMFAYVARVTGNAKVSYVGFSQGSAQVLAALAADPTLARRVRHVVALAPASTVRHMERSALTSIVEANLGFLNLLFGRRHILAMTHAWQRILPAPRFVAVVDRSMRYLFGWDTGRIDPARKPALYRHIFSLSSVKVVKHWMQIMYSGRFQHFDDTPEPSLLAAALASLRVLLSGGTGAERTGRPRRTGGAEARWTEHVVDPEGEPLAAFEKRGRAASCGGSCGGSSPAARAVADPAQSSPPEASTPERTPGAAQLQGARGTPPTVRAVRAEAGAFEERAASPEGPKGGGVFDSVTPRYDLGAVACPVTLVYGDRDRLMHVGPMAHRLRRCRVFRVAGYEHLDLIWGRNAGRAVFPIVVSALLESEDAAALHAAKSGGEGAAAPATEDGTPWLEDAWSDVSSAPPTPPQRSRGAAGGARGGGAASPGTPPQRKSVRSLGAKGLHFSDLFPASRPKAGSSSSAHSGGTSVDASVANGSAASDDGAGSSTANAAAPAPYFLGNVGEYSSPQRAPGTGLPLRRSSVVGGALGPAAGRPPSASSMSTLDDVDTPGSRGSDAEGAVRV